MAERLKAFLKDVSTLRAQQSAEQLARMDRLKAMTPEQFARLPRSELQELTDRQYAEVVSPGGAGASASGAAGGVGGAG
ncbi:hypothetical protein ACVWXL_005862 [Bradyrhizobium sp. GM22.5]